MQNNKLKILLIFLILFSSILNFIPIVNSDITVTLYPGTVFNVDNVNYSVSTALNFRYIAVEDTNITFNSTTFEIASVNPVNISLNYLNDDIINMSTIGSIALNFTAFCSGGTVRFNISGFNASKYYHVHKNNTLIGYFDINSTGYLCFNISSWSWGYITAELRGPSPTVTTNASTGVEETNATLNGYLVSDGGEDCTVGFEYGTTTGYGTTTSYNNDGFYENTSLNYGLAPYQSTWYSENFTASFSYKISGISLPLNTVGTAKNGTIHLRLADSNGFPDGSDLVSCFLNASTVVIPSPGWAWYNYYFSSPYQLIKGTSYTIVINTSGTVLNWIIWKESTTDQYLSGEKSISFDSGTSWAVRTGDFGFRTIQSPEFSYNLTSISPGTLYHFRAFANNSNGFGYGTDKKFITKPYEPTGLTITNTGSGELTLNWIHGLGYNRTVVRGSIGAYPASPTVGTAIYNNTGTTVIISGLTEGDEWYYRAWEYANESGEHQFSDGYAQNNEGVINISTVTTNASTGMEETNSTLNGYLVSDGGENCTVGFEYGTNISYGTNITINTVNYYNQTITDNWVLMATGGYATRCAYRDTSFTGKITNVSWLLKKSGYPTGNLYCRVRYVSNDTLIVQSSTIIDSSTLTATNTWYTFIFSNDTYLTTQDIYIEIEYNPTHAGLHFVWVALSTPNVDGYYYIAPAYTLDFTATIKLEYILSFSTGSAFSYNLSGLSPGTLYYYRAFAVNGYGYGYGVNKTFLTKPWNSTGLDTTPKATSINLTWTKGDGANNTRIQRKTTGYPTSRADAVNIYNGTGSSYNNTGLLPVQFFFCRGG